MSSATLYGQAQSEKRAEENATCRQIVREIGNFGVSQRQMLLIIHLLASELENVEHMRAITRLVRDLDSDLFLIGSAEPDSPVSDGSPDE